MVIDNRRPCLATVTRGGIGKSARDKGYADESCRARIVRHVRAIVPRATALMFLLHFGLNI